MSQPDRPLTARELARLFRAFANMAERAAEQEAPAPAPRKARQTKKAAAATAATAANANAPVSDIAVERARRSMRRMGVIA